MGKVNMGEIRKENFERVFDRFTKSKDIHEGFLLIEDRSGDFKFGKGYGGRELHSPLLMASITKLFTTTCILIFLDQGKLLLEDKLTKFFSNSFLAGLHVFHGQEYTFELTISHLLYQTSGLPDIYEEGKESAKKRFINEDFYFRFDELLDWVKKLEPHFPPRGGGTPCSGDPPRNWSPLLRGGKAYYADINFDILGEIIEKVSDSSLAQVYKQYIFEPLGLANTYLPESENDFIPGIYYKNRLIHRPKFVLSSRASGGCITTAYDLMIFIKAFFGGGLFNRTIFDRISAYNKLQAAMGPVYYGGGYMRIPLSGLATFFLGKGELIGHSGSTGSFAFYYPLKDLFFVGDINQMSNAAIPLRLTMRLAMTTK